MLKSRSYFMRIAIMQAYLFPYLGYFQLINAVDAFIVYDNIEYTKKGWINRNRILLNGKDHLFTIPLKKDRDYLNINERYLSDNAPAEIAKILGQIKSAYAKAPYYREIFPLIENLFLNKEAGLFDYIFKSISGINNYLGIKTPMYVSSELPIDHSLKGKDKVISLCKYMNATTYLNPVGGSLLYKKEDFEEHNIELLFHKMDDVSYKQAGDEFVPSLSIIDVLMHNSVDKMQGLLEKFTVN